MPQVPDSPWKMRDAKVHSSPLPRVIGGTSRTLPVRSLFEMESKPSDCILFLRSMSQLLNDAFEMMVTLKMSEAKAMLVEAEKPKVTQGVLADTSSPRAGAVSPAFPHRCQCTVFDYSVRSPNAECLGAHLGQPDVSPVMRPGTSLACCLWPFLKHTTLFRAPA